MTPRERARTIPLHPRQFVGEPEVRVRPGPAVLFLGGIVEEVLVKWVDGPWALVEGIGLPIPIDRVCQMPWRGEG